MTDSDNDMGEKADHQLSRGTAQPEEDSGAQEQNRDNEESGTQDEQPEKEFTVPGMPDIAVDSFHPKYVYQVQPDINAMYDTFMGDLLHGLAAATGTHVMMGAAMLPGVLAACIGPGLVVCPYEGSAWRQKVNFWPAVLADSGSGSLHLHLRPITNATHMLYTLMLFLPSQLPHYVQSTGLQQLTMPLFAQCIAPLHLNIVAVTCI